MKNEICMINPSNWLEIVSAWVLWMGDKGPPVQYKDTYGAWRDWGHTGIINSMWGKEWRVKPQPKRVRPYYNPENGFSALKEWAPGKPEPITGLGYEWVPGSTWLEVPEAAHTSFPSVAVNGCKRVRPYYNTEKKSAFVACWYPDRPEPALTPFSAWVPGSAWLEIPQ